MRNGEEYLQSPIDDLHSFYYVGQWATLFNAHSGDASDFMKGLQNEAINNRDGVRREVLFLNPALNALSPFLARCQPILVNWYRSLIELELQWHHAMVACPPPTADAQKYDYFVPLFRKFAVAGILDYYKLVAEHRTELQLPYTLAVRTSIPLHSTLTDEVE